MPYKTALGPFYDCGEFSRNMEMALEAADHAGFRRAPRGVPRARHAARHRLRQCDRAGRRPDAGICGNSFQAERQCDAADGHQDAWPGPRDRRSSRSCCERSASIPKEVQFIDGDTDRVAFGMGSNGSRSMVIGGGALTLAAEKIIDKGKRIAAHLLEAAEADIEFAEGRFNVAGTDRGVTLKDVARGSIPAGAAAAGHGAGLLRARHLCADARHLPQRLPCLRGGDRSGHRRRRSAVLSGRGRRRHGDQSADAGGPNSRRRRAGRRPDPDGAGGL